jgi:hypothetical protein
MASLSRSGTRSSPYVHLTEATATALPEEFIRMLKESGGLALRKQGDAIMVKGKGRMQTYCIESVSTEAVQ